MGLQSLAESRAKVITSVSNQFFKITDSILISLLCCSPRTVSLTKWTGNDEVDFDVNDLILIAMM